jgi:serine/threonine-protein kinase
VHAASLDPSLIYARIFLARQFALQGRWAEAEEQLGEIDRRRGPSAAHLALALRVRIAAWQGDHEALRRWAAEGDPVDPRNWRIVRLYAQAIAGELSADEVRRQVGDILAGSRNPRFLSLAAQLAAEMFAARGEVDEARAHLLRAAAEVLVDLAWTDGCPLLAPLRALPEWAEARRRIRARADGIWSG